MTAVNFRPGSSTLGAGVAAKITGLVSKPQFNSRIAKVTSFDTATGRYNVCLVPSGDVLAVREQNLEIIQDAAAILSSSLVLLQYAIFARHFLCRNGVAQFAEQSRYIRQDW